ncbi:threonyl-tRNA synthetase [Candidatus Thiomargarita nelsonii]|uniref:Threonine--tRNA ligase n=1 Tax=Candidatus Thiomargarita nelsonii TaxID=1003181 RepID=A0A176S082_9GAMM|nr:threonyl-tRNA synthetase [Candidatus Thiomargarita nelsonii]
MAASCTRKPLFPWTIGPVVENGFYYDFAYKKTFTPHDLEQIQAKMKKLAAENLSVTRSVMSRDEAIQFFRAQGEEYKAQIIDSIPTNDDISLYKQGDFTDLCRGPHVPSTGKLKAFKLMKVAGAYWRGDPNNEMLQRIYGTAWATKKQLKEYLHRLAEAEKRDHRKLGKYLDLFHVQEEAPGMVFWHDKGWTVYLLIQDYIRRLLRQHGYQEVNTPQLVDRSLWEKSGHWDKFGDMIFSTHSENRDYAVKPMNCPCHIQIFNQGLKSFRELPLRMAEFGSCHRNEPSGTLHGLLRIRNFVQDDAHIFCTEEQIQSEVSDFIDLVFNVYGDFGFRDIIVKLSTRPEQRVGSFKVSALISIYSAISGACASRYLRLLSILFFLSGCNTLKISPENLIKYSLTPLWLPCSGSSIEAVSPVVYLLIKGPNFSGCMILCRQLTEHKFCLHNFTTSSIWLIKELGSCLLFA